MRSKSVLSAVVFITAFVFSVAVSPRANRAEFLAAEPVLYCAHQSESASRLLARDVANGNLRDSRIDAVVAGGYRHGSTVFNEKYVSSITDYVEKSGALPTEELPAEFRDAWQNHIQVWDSYARFLEENIDGEGNLVRERGFYRESARYDDEISRTWKEVLRVGQKVNARIPASEMTYLYDSE